MDRQCQAVGWLVGRLVGWLVGWLVGCKERGWVERNEMYHKDGVGGGWIVVVGWGRSWGQLW